MVGKADILLFLRLTEWNRPASPSPSRAGVHQMWEADMVKTQH